ncbi:MAG: S-methyl-5-thioribose-1-phosphate isomerase [Candidatus Omnitrophica bacterium]|jgi:methylthioribose-1-phosphate isomerase|nr:S-methyl-5-thioribose-1-phosphate isomerase [Candidatus Omnitrophota bacterium]
MKLSPLFWPIELKGSTIYILDETLLPHKFKYIKAKDYKQAVKAIKDMKTRAVGQVILVFYIFLLVIRKNKNKKDIKPILFKLAESINAARPTLSFKYLTDMILGWMVSGAPLEKSILGFLEILKNKRIQQARAMSELLNDGDSILTHCNISGQMPLIGELARQQNKKVKFFATETRPYLQGSRLTAWELQRQGFDVTLISDNMVAQVMYEKKVNKVIVGADHLAQNGDIANKVGTYQIAILAKHFNVPFYVLCPPPSRSRTGKDITIEIRPQIELLEYQGISLAPKGAKGYYPAFDVTPNNLITEHIYLEINDKV